MRPSSQALVQREHKMKLPAHATCTFSGVSVSTISTVWSPAPGFFPVHGNRPGYIFRATLSTLESSRLHRSVHSIAGSEDKDSPMNPAEDITPGQQCATTSSRRVIVPTSDIELSDFDEPDWKDVKTRKKRKKTSPNSSLSAETVCSAGVVPEGLTVVFTPLEEGHVITSLSSLKLSLALEKMFPECILEIRFNNRLNLIAVDVRNGQTTRGLLRCTVLCGIKVRAYEPLPRHCATGVIRDVDTTLTDEEIANNLRSPENRAKVQRSRSPSADRRCQATFTSVMSGMQFHNSKRIHFNAASVAAMDIERQPASAARCANAAAARMRTETPALLKKIHESGWPELPRKSEGPSSTAQDTSATITENQVPERPTYAALTKQGPISPDLIQLEDPTTSGNTPADPRKRRTPKRKTPSRNTQPLRLLNVYCRPQDRYARFDTLFEAARRKDCGTFIAGDFNAPHPTWGYPRDTPKGRKLHTLIQQHNLTLLTDPSTPTRLGTSVARDTCPDLTLYRGTNPCTWHNLEEQLGSDHSILVTHINTKDFAGEARKIRITDWPAFRASSSSTSPDTLTDWVQTLQTRLDRHTRTLTTTPDAPDIDSHLLHLWEARRGLTKRPQDARGGITVVVNSDLRLVHAATERGLTEVSLLEEHIPGNECAHALARELSNRAPGEDSATIRPAPFSYSTHLAELRLARQHYPPPQPSLTRRQGVLWRQLQTNTFPTPLFYSYVYPSLGPPECPHCGDRPTLLHMVWQCQAIPSVSPLPNPTPTSWEERLTDDTATGQQWLVDRAESVAATYGAPD
ncbi:hypothetical protein HPB47_023913 [Ixodes persulcatus]|uniref:Uncharacterized protein n=1 Tax=Ixodes persulcatus TaxID=34615 RepID=A0AC60QZH8_IXOPE|nr:hypothetical protein HPB47_023913 [Ixodes persulcatus]